MKNIITSGKAKEKILRYKPAQKVIIMHPSGEGNILGCTWNNFCADFEMYLGGQNSVLPLTFLLKELRFILRLETIVFRVFRRSTFS